MLHSTLPALKERGIVVTATGGQATSTAELTWALILACVRNVALEDAAIRAGRWQTTIGPSLHSRVLGVIGLGRLGTQVANVGRAFGMDVLAWSRSLTPEKAAEHGATLVSKDGLLSRSDVVSLHVSLNDSSRGLIGAREFSLMKRDAYLINTSRSLVVDQDALIEALQQGRIAGAGLDVYDQEPLPPAHPILSAPRTVLTPHLGYVTTDGYRIFYEQCVEDIQAYLEAIRFALSARLRLRIETVDRLHYIYEVELVASHNNQQSPIASPRTSQPPRGRRSRCAGPSRLRSAKAAEELARKTDDALHAVSKAFPASTGRGGPLFLNMRGKVAVHLIGGPKSGADSMIGLQATSTRARRRQGWSRSKRGLLQVPVIAQTPAARDRRIRTLSGLRNR